MWNMPQKISSPDRLDMHARQGTYSIIRQAYLNTTTKKIVKNPSYLEDEHLPEAERIAAINEVFHRNIRSKQIDRLARSISPVLGGELPPNLLIYGPTGAGKTVTCLHFLATLSDMCEETGVNFRFVYVDLTTPHTCFGAFNELALALDGTHRRYRKGIAMDYMQTAIINSLSQRQEMVCILVDEVDNITIDGDIFFIFLAKTLQRKVKARLFYIFLTNRSEWERTIDPRILSVLKKTDLIFEPYDAMDLVSILDLRVEKALDRSKVDEGAVRKIAAYASRETGDARKAVELLVKAVKVAEEKSGFLGESEVDEADCMLEIDKTEELIGSLAAQQFLALQACYAGLGSARRHISTGQAYEAYAALCARDGTRVLTQRRLSEILSLFDVYGLINARVVSRGRYGKTRELSGSLPPDIVKRLLAGKTESGS